MSLKFAPKVQINNIQAPVQIMAWRRPDDKVLSEPMMVSLPMRRFYHNCVYMQDIYVYMQDNHVYMQNNNVYIIT